METAKKANFWDTFQSISDDELTVVVGTWDAYSRMRVLAANLVTPERKDGFVDDCRERISFAGKLDDSEVRDMWTDHYTEMIKLVKLPTEQLRRLNQAVASSAVKTQATTQ